MKSTGIIRKLDKLNRVVIPKELCKVFGINVGDPVEIFTEDGGLIVLKKFSIEDNIEINFDYIEDYLKRNKCSEDMLSKLNEVRNYVKG